MRRLLLASFFVAVLLLPSAAATTRIAVYCEGVSLTPPAADPGRCGANFTDRTGSCTLVVCADTNGQILVGVVAPWDPDCRAPDDCHGYILEAPAQLCGTIVRYEREAPNPTPHEELELSIREPLADIVRSCPVSS